jgi:ribosomal 30S subunit maturation factor RimM
MSNVMTTKIVAAYSFDGYMRVLSRTDVVDAIIWIYVGYNNTIIHLLV